MSDGSARSVCCSWQLPQLQNLEATDCRTGQKFKLLLESTGYCNVKWSNVKMMLRARLAEGVPTTQIQNLTDLFPTTGPCSQNKYAEHLHLNAYECKLLL